MGKTRLFGLLLLGVLIGSLTIQTGWAEVTHLSFWTVWGVDKASHKALSALVEEFNAQNPDIFVEIVPTAANEEKLIVALLGGTPPDLVTVDFNATGRFEEFMVPLDSLGIRDDFDPNDIFPGIIDRYFNPEGIWYTMPLHIDCQVLLINAEKADAAGLPVFDPPENWYEFEDWGLKMTDKSRWQWGAALSFVFRDQPRSLLWRWTPHLWQAGADLFDENGRPAFNTPGAIEALEFWQRAVNEYAPMVHPSTYWNLFIAQQAAMQLESMSFYLQAKERGVNVKVAPALKHEERVTNIGGWSVGIFNEAKAEASYRFLKWLSQPENNAKFLTIMGGTPARQSVFASEVYQKHIVEHPDFITFVDAISYCRILPFMTDEVVQVLGRYLKEAIEGVTGAGMALAQAEEQLLAIMQ